MKPFEKAGLIVAFLLCAIGLARADCPTIAPNKAHVCWSAPTTNTDGSAIAGAITYTVQQQSGSTWTNVGTGITATDWTSTVLAPGSYAFRVLATVAAVDSAPAAASGTKVVPVPTPNPPSGAVVAQVTVEITSPAFRIIGEYPHATRGAFIANVPVGRDCTGPVLFRKNGYNFRQVLLLPTDKTWQDAGPAPKTAAAPCVRVGA